MKKKFTTEELKKFIIDEHGWRVPSQEIEVIIARLHDADRLEKRWDILKKWANELDPKEQISASALQTEIAD